MIPQDLIDRILRETAISEIVGTVVELKRSGRNLVGLCPFHLEKTPSFNVSPERQIYKCFGCGEGGNAVSFLQRMNGHTFPEAIRVLGERLGIEVIDDRKEPDAWRKEKDRKERLLEVMERACVFYQRQLAAPAAESMRQYLQRRCIRPETANLFRLGFAPGGSALVEAAMASAVAKGSLVDSGLASHVQDAPQDATGDDLEIHDFFYNRLMFPIADERGRTIAFGARTLLDRGPKYLNSRETIIFEKSATLYGLGQAKSEIARTRHALLMEGYTDVILAHQAGYTNAVATLGTALTPFHIQILRRFVERIDLVYDGDAAGLAAARRGLDLLAEGGLEARVVVLPGGQDPGDMLANEEGIARFAAQLEHSLEPIEFVIRHASKEHGLDSVDAKAKAIRDSLGYAARARSVEQEILLSRIATAFSVNLETLRVALAEEVKKKSDRRGSYAAPAGAAPVAAAATAASDRAPRQMGSYNLSRASRGGRWRVEEPHEGVIVACLARPELLGIAEEKLAVATLAATHPELAHIYEELLDLHHAHAEINVAMLMSRIHESAASLLDRLLQAPVHDPVTHLRKCLSCIEQPQRLSESERIKLELGQASDASQRDSLLQEWLSLARERPGHG